MATATKIPFRTAYSGAVKHACPTGDGYELEYGYEYGENNEKELVITGKKNLYEEIQSYHEETKIENILKRVAIGDMSDFRPNGIYADITSIPNNLIEQRKEMQKAENFFNSMPLEVRRKYGFSLDRFINDIGTKAWLEATGLINPEKKEAPTQAKAPETTVEVPNDKTD